MVLLISDVFSLLLLPQTGSNRRYWEIVREEWLQISVWSISLKTQIVILKTRILGSNGDLVLTFLI